MDTEVVVDTEGHFTWQQPASEDVSLKSIVQVMKLLIKELF